MVNRISMQTPAMYKAAPAQAAKAGEQIPAFKKPVDGVAGDKFGMRLHPVDKTWKLHKGQDYKAPMGTEVKASADGKVTFVGNMVSAGNVVKIDHGGGFESWYFHLKSGSFEVKPGQVVKAGAKIAEVGSTGKSTGPHLHFQIMKDGLPTDPIKLIK